ncbi:hypothetical protein GCM10010385_38850 [Streptomyces geysiriensis]|nr:hypothetical protein GCM10010385_38850 [Streptomyces geysiriensis]
MRATRPGVIALVKPTSSAGPGAVARRPSDGAGYVRKASWAVTGDGTAVTRLFLPAPPDDHIARRRCAGPSTGRYLARCEPNDPNTSAPPPTVTAPRGVP